MNQRLVAILATVLAIVAFFPGLVFRGESFVCRDAGGTLYPVKAFAAARLLSGELPLWYPYDGLGTPLIGSTIPGLFHPTTLLHLILPVPTALRVSDLLAFGVACLATWVLARRLGAAHWAAAAAAFAYAFSGPLVGNVSAQPYLYGGAVYPLFLLGLHGIVAGPARRGLAIAAAALALAVLGGDIQSAYLFGLTGLPFILALEPEGRSVSPTKRVAWLAGVGALGLALSAVQLLPSLDAYLATERGEGLAFEHAALWSFHPLRLPELFLGDLVRWRPGATEPNLIRADLIQSVGLWSTTVTLGTTVLLGVVLALALRPRRMDLVLLGTAGVLLILAMGRHSPVFRVFFDFVPLGSAFRFPEKMVLHASLPLTLVAARSLNSAVVQRGSRRALTATVAVVLGLAVVAGAAGLGSLTTGSSAWGVYLGRLGSSALTSAAVAGLAGFLLFAPRRWPALSPLRCVGVPLICFLQLLAWNGRVPAECAAPEWVLEAPSLPAEAVRGHAERAPHTYRVAPLFQRHGSAGAGNLELSGAARLFLWERQALIPDHNAVSGLEGIGTVLPVVLPALADVERIGPMWRWYPLYNVEYLVGAPDDLAALPELPLQTVERLPGLDMTVARLTNALPRAYLAAGLPARDRDEATTLLQRPEVLTGRMAVVEQAVASKGAGPPVGTAVIRSWAPEQVVVEVDTDRPSMLVLNDAWFPGWRAHLGEREVPVLQTNLLVRGVEVPPGRHRITFTYPIPLVLSVGGLVTALGVVLLVLLVLFRLPSEGHRRAGRG